MGISGTNLGHIMLAISVTVLAEDGILYQKLNKNSFVAHKKNISSRTLRTVREKLIHTRRSTY
jgi:hypothetical protein